MEKNPEVEALLAVYREAAYARDVDRFMTIYATRVRVFDTWGPWDVHGSNEWRTSIGEWFGSLGDDRTVVEFDAIETTVSGDLAVVSAMVSYSGESPSGDRIRQMTNRLTWVLERKGDAWLVTHEHTSAPLDMETGSVVLER